jgi:voltage-gated sodium channel
MRPESKPALKNGSQGASLRSSDKTSHLLEGPVIDFRHGVKVNMPNRSGDLGEVYDGIFLDYNIYKDQEEYSNKSNTSVVSQDTFTTFDADKNRSPVWGKPRYLPKFAWLHAKLPWADRVVKTRFFKRLSIALILLNCVLAAIATSDWVMESRHRKYYFDLAKEVFVYIMSAELCMQFLSNGIDFFLNGWLIFDFLFVGLGWVMPTLLVVRTFRVVRTLRLVSWVKDLKELVIALLLVIPKMFAIFFLLLILFVIFSILFTDLFKYTYSDGVTKEDYFSRIDVTFFTLFQIMTLDGWAEICKEIMEVYPWAWAPFVGFVIVSSFFFLNLVIAVVSDAVTSVHQATVVKYLQDEMSVATSARDVFKVQDRLDELASSIQLIIQAQIALLEGLEKKHTPDSPTSQQQKEKVRKTTVSLKAELDRTMNKKRAWRELTPVIGNRFSPYPRVADDDLSDVSGPRLIPNGESVTSGPSSVGFWREIGLSDQQIATVMDRFQAWAEQGPLETTPRASKSELRARPAPMDAANSSPYSADSASRPSPSRGAIT